MNRATSSTVTTIITNASTSRNNAPEYAAEKQSKRDERTKQRKLEQVEQMISDIETRITELEHLMTDPDVMLDYIKLRDIQEQIETSRVKLDDYYTEWEALSK